MKRISLLLLMLVSATAMADTREYGVATILLLCLPDFDDQRDFDDVLTFEAGDVTLTRTVEGVTGVATNVTTLPTDEGVCYEQTLSAAEMEAELIVVAFIDQTSPKEWSDEAIYIDTYGDDDSQHPNIDDANVLTLNGCTITGNPTTGTPFSIVCP